MPEKSIFSDDNPKPDNGATEVSAIAPPPKEEPKKKRGRPPTKKKAQAQAIAEAEQMAQDKAAAAMWSQLFFVVNKAFDVEDDGELSKALGDSFYTALKLTWPDESPVQMAWIQFGTLAGFTYGPVIKQKFFDKKKPALEKKE